MIKAYSGFDANLGPEEGACLVFAYNSRQAKKLAYSILRNWGSEYIDVRVRWLKDEDYLFKQMRSDKPHVIESPETCDICGMWGGGEIINGVCEMCRED